VNPARWGAVAVLVVIGVAGGAVYALGGSSDGDDRLDLVVLGDSFVEHSRDQIAAYATNQGLTNLVQGLGGTAICNWDKQIAEQEADPPKVLVLSFAGNDIPKTCINPTGESRPAAEVARLYGTALEKIVDRFADEDVELWVVLPPPIRDAEFEERAAAMRTMYRQAAEDHPGLHLIDSATNLDPEATGEFQKTLPCRDDDPDCPSTGQVVVRRDDGIHLTPAGATRYAHAIVDAVER